MGINSLGFNIGDTVDHTDIPYVRGTIVAFEPQLGGAVNLVVSSNGALYRDEESTWSLISSSTPPIYPEPYPEPYQDDPNVIDVEYTVIE